MGGGEGEVRMGGDQDDGEDRGHHGKKEEAYVKFNDMKEEKKTKRFE